MPTPAEWVKECKGEPGPELARIILAERGNYDAGRRETIQALQAGGYLALIINGAFMVSYEPFSNDPLSGSAVAELARMHPDLLIKV